MDVGDAYARLGSYRAVAEVCGVDPKTVKRKVLAHEAGLLDDERASRAPVPKNTDGVRTVVLDLVREADGRGTAKPLLPAARAAGHVGSDRNFRRLVARPAGVRRWRLGPVARDEAPVPGDHGRGLHDEEHLAEPSPVEDGGEQREDGPARLGENGTRDLTLQHEDLVAQRQDLGIAIVASREDPSEPCEDKTGEGREEAHRPMTVPSALHSPKQNRTRRRRALGTCKIRQDQGDRWHREGSDRAARNACSACPDEFPAPTPRPMRLEKPATRSHVAGKRQTS